MTQNLSERYPHIVFRRIWDIDNPKMNYLLGQCEALIKAICNTPILPEYHTNMLMLSLNKGAQATTAIEGNTLSDEEIERVSEGEKLPPSKEYQEIEVKNILDAFNELLNEVIAEHKSQLISEELLLRLHKMVGKDLGEHFGAIPGRFRENNVIVGKYRCPDYKDVPYLVKGLTEWLLTEFNYRSGQQDFKDTVIQAIVTHIYTEWIHPFGDGNGRTGRLLEFYILLRGKSPDIASHILSNHYNTTRTEYYRQIQQAYERRDLTEFIIYALQGFKDGLDQTLFSIQKSQLGLTWQKFVYDKFNDVKMVKKDVFKRKRALMLAMPLDKELSIEEFPVINTQIARMYATLSERQIRREVNEYVRLKLLIKKNDRYLANTPLLKDGYMARRKR